tara:strand:- start:1011 stop:1580 length:570 start_codon:yes stop_codon:yes gene_type:complete
METFLIGFLSVAIPMFMYFTLGGRNTLYIFGAICIFGILVAVFEDNDFSSSEDERNKNTDSLLQNDNNTACDKNDKTVYSFDGITSTALPECLYSEGTGLDRQVTIEDVKYSLPLDPVRRCYFWHITNLRYGYTEDPSIEYKEGDIVKSTIDGIERKWSMPNNKGERCILYASIENFYYDNIFIYEYLY